MKKLLLSFMFVLIGIFSFVGLSVQAAAVYDHEVTFDMNGGDYVHDDIATFGNKLDAGTEPLTALVIGDSTSVDNDEWYYLMSEQLGLNNLDYTVEHRLFNSSTLSFGTSSNIQYGAAGDAYAVFDGESGSYLSTLNNSKFSILGDLDLRTKIEVDPGAGVIVLSKWSTGSSYQLAYFTDATGTSGKISFSWTEDGSTVLNEDSGFFTVSATDPIWIQMAFEVDDGVAGYEIVFKYSDDGVTWTTADTDTSVTGATSIYDSTSSIEIGSYGGGLQGNFEGKIYNVEVRDGIDGEIVVAVDFDQAFPSTINNFKDIVGNTWVLNGGITPGNGSPSLLMLNGSIGSSKTTTFNANYLSSMTKVDVDLVFISLGHNETDDDYVDTIEGFIDDVKLYAPDAKIILVTQNPQTSPRTASQILQQLNRMDQVKLVAARNDIAFIDVYSVLATDTTSYVSTDGVHPTDAGAIVWADVVSDALDMRTGSGYSDFSILVEDAELIIAIDTPVKDGATFIGWFTNETLTNEWDLETDLVQDDTILYAKWSTSSTSGTSIFAPAADTYSFLGIAWYWYGVVAVAVYYFGFNKKGRKIIGLK